MKQIWKKKFEHIWAINYFGKTDEWTKQFEEKDKKKKNYQNLQIEYLNPVNTSNFNGYRIENYSFYMCVKGFSGFTSSRTRKAE